MRLFLVSPPDNSGISWLANCLLELGIRVEPAGGPSIWRRDGKESVLRESGLKYVRLLPALRPGRRFRFREDLDASFSHYLPRPKHDGAKAVLFVRDPRDAIYSRRRRESPELSFMEYLGLRDHNALLTRLDYWGFFMRCWLAHPGAVWLRFEDSKSDPVGTLRRAVEHGGLRFDDDALLRATENSTFEKARDAERRLAEGAAGGPHNHSGQAFQWKTRPEEARAHEWIASTHKELLDAFGYEGGTNTRVPPLELYRRRLRHFDGVRIPETLLSPSEAAASEREAVRAYAAGLTFDFLNRSGVPRGWVTTQLESLGAFLVCDGALSELDGLASLYARFADPADFYYRLFVETRRSVFLFRAGPLASTARIVGALWRRAARATGRLAGVSTRHAIED